MRLTRSEDGQLRRLHFFEQCGAELARALDDQLRALRSRDLRGAVREPWESGVLSPAVEDPRRAAAAAPQA